MTSEAGDELLRFAAERAARRPEFLAWALARYLELERVPEETLRQRLAIDPEDWTRLRLCRRPCGEHFAQGVDQIAKRFGLNAEELTQVLRFVENITTLTNADPPGGWAPHGPPAPPPGRLLAARSRKNQDAGRKDDDRPGA